MKLYKDVLNEAVDFVEKTVKIVNGMSSLYGILGNGKEKQITAKVFMGLNAPYKPDELAEYHYNRGLSQSTKDTWQIRQINDIDKNLPFDEQLPLRFAAKTKATKKGFKVDNSALER